VRVVRAAAADVAGVILEVVAVAVASKLAVEVAAVVWGVVTVMEDKKRQYEKAFDLDVER